MEFRTTLYHLVVSSSCVSWVKCTFESNGAVEPHEDWGSAATQWVNLVQKTVIFLFSNWASACMIRTSGESVQKVGSFTEIFLKGTGSGAAEVSSIDTAEKGKGMDSNRQKPYYGVGLKNAGTWLEPLSGTSAKGIFLDKITKNVATLYFDKRRNRTVCVYWFLSKPRLIIWHGDYRKYLVCIKILMTTMLVLYSLSLKKLSN